MKYFLPLLLIVGCSTSSNEIAKENKRLTKEVDSLRNELQECEMMLKVYENDPLSI